MQAGAQYLRKMREGQGLTQEQVAAILNVAAKTIHNLETGKSDPRSSMLFAVFRVVHASADTFYSLIEDDDADESDGEYLAEFELGLAKIRKEFGDDVYFAAMNDYRRGLGKADLNTKASVALDAVRTKHGLN